MKIKRRFPNFFSGFEADETEHEVTSKEELLEIPWIDKYKENTNHIGMFYSPSNMDGLPDHLMALHNSPDGVGYFVVGYIYGDGKELGLENYLEHLN